MTFLNPTLALAGFACVAVPILIHILMRRRRRPLPWGAMKFLLEAYRQQRRRTRLEQILLLASRCLLIALLALAFGRPLLAGRSWSDSAGPRTLYILLDNSLTSGLIRPDGSTDLDALKAQAQDLLKSLSPSRGDRAALVTLAGPPDPVVLPPASDTAAILQSIQRLTPLDSAADLPAGLALVRDQLAARDGGPVQVALLSAWRTGSADTTKPLAPLAAGEQRDSPIAISVSPPAQPQAANVAVTEITPLTTVLIEPAPGQPPATAQARITLRRTAGESAGSTPVTLRVLSATGTWGPPTSGLVNWQPRQEAAAIALAAQTPPGLTGDAGAALVASIGPDALEGDNSFRLPLTTRAQVRVALITPRSPIASPGKMPTPDQFQPVDWLTLALSPAANRLDPRASEVAVTIVEPTQVSTQTLAAADAIVVPRPDLLDDAGWRALRAALDGGRVVVITPPPATTAKPWHASATVALGVAWKLADEPKEHLLPVKVLEPATSDEHSLLAMLGPELAELVKPVIVQKVWPSTPSPESVSTLLKLEDQTPLLLAGLGPAARGLAVFVAVSPDLQWTNLPAMPLMVPLFQEILRQGVGRASGTAWIPAGSRPLWPDLAAAARPLPSAPEQPAASGDAGPIRNAAGPLPQRRRGAWRAIDAAGKTLGLFAVNADTVASAVAPQPRRAVEAWLAPLSGPRAISWLDETPGTPTADARSTESTPADSNPLDAVLLGAAGLLALIELALGRWFSHASIDAAQPGLSSVFSTGATGGGGRPS